MQKLHIKALVHILYDTLETSGRDDVVKWNVRGSAFMVLDPETLCTILSKSGFKCPDMNYFRQMLLRYGFEKIKLPHKTIEKYGRDVMGFRHPCFQKGKLHLLENIHLKVVIESTINEFTGTKYYKPNKDMYVQKQIMRSIMSVSHYLQVICDGASELKQEVLRRANMKKIRCPRAMICEEDVCIRISLFFSLRKAGFNACIAEDCDDVVLKCRIKPFRFIILSKDMSNIITALKKIKEVRRHAVIALTYEACMSENNFEDFRKLGVSEFLQKPCSERCLVSIIEKI